MARQPQGKERNAPVRPTEPASSNLPEPTSPTPESEPEPVGGVSIYWWLVLLVWVGCAAVLWGTELVGLIIRLFSSGPPA